MKFAYLIRGKWPVCFRPGALERAEMLDPSRRFSAIGRIRYSRKMPSHGLLDEKGPGTLCLPRASIQ